MSRRKSRERKRFSTDTDAWMITFGDLLMLLLTFFVLLISMKNINAFNVERFFERFILAERSEGIRTRTGMGGERETYFIASKAALVRKIKPGSAFFKAADNISEDERGVVISLSADRLFDSGEVRIRQSAVKVLDDAGVFFRSVSNDVLILGHTDAVPLKQGARFESNWELSCYRGLSVFHHFVDGMGLDAGRFAVGGYADTRPAWRDGTESSKAKNRRIEFILRNFK